MANVIQCDICGKLLGRACLVTLPALSMIDNTNPLEVDLDFCPDCAVKVKDFVDILKSGEKYTIWIDPPETMRCDKNKEE